MNAAFVKLEQFLAISFLNPVFPLPNRAEIVAKSIGNGGGGEMEQKTKMSRRQEDKIPCLLPPSKAVCGDFLSLP